MIILFLILTEQLMVQNKPQETPMKKRPPVDASKFQQSLL